MTTPEITQAIKDLDLCVYKATHEEDILLMHWWLHLNESGDLWRILPCDATKLSSFYKLFASPSILNYVVKDNRIWFAAWIEPAFANRAGFLSLWTDATMRHTPTNFRVTQLAYNLALTWFPHIFGITKQADLLDVHVKIGYDIIGQFEKLYDDENDAWIVHIDRDGFDSARLNRR